MKKTMSALGCCGQSWQILPKLRYSGDLQSRRTPSPKPACRGILAMNPPPVYEQANGFLPTPNR